MTHCLCFRFLSCSVWSRRRRRASPPLCCPQDPHKKCHPCHPFHQSSQDPPHCVETRHQTSHSSSRLSFYPKFSVSLYHLSFQVLFLGKIKSSHKRAPQTFIDDALRKFKIRESKLKEQAEDNKVNSTSPATNEAKAISPSIFHPLNDLNIGTDRVSPSKAQPDSRESNNANSAKNRTMLLQVGRTDLRLISPDTKQVLLHKSFREISHVARGQEEEVHFGFICKLVIFQRF